MKSVDNPKKVKPTKPPVTPMVVERDNEVIKDLP
jgi:hypothetical protein